MHPMALVAMLASSASAYAQVNVSTVLPRAREIELATSVAYMLQGDISNFDAATGKIIARRFPPHVMIYAPGITPNEVGLFGRAAVTDTRVPLIYNSATG